MRRFPKLLFFILIALLMAISSVAQDDDSNPGMLTNPINDFAGADPWLQYYEGNYYLATTTGQSHLIMRKSPTLAGLRAASPVTIYVERESDRCCNMWAPEFYLIDGPNGPRWYYYYSAGTVGTHDNQRMHVLESEGTDPMGPYHYQGRLFDASNDGWAIDTSIMFLNDEMYALFSSWTGPNQNMYIARMSDPWTIDGQRHLLSTPQYPWEKSGGSINEGPVALQHDDQTFIVYSGSYCGTPEYKLGMLTYLGGDPLDIDSWEKNPEPVFSPSPENGVYGAGHNGFFKSPDGTEDWIVYHATTSPTGGCNDARTTRVQPFTWNDDGTPNFGIPVALDEEIQLPSGDPGPDSLLDIELPPATRFRSFKSENAYIRHRDEFVSLDLGPTPVEDSQFMIRPGLADEAGISIESVNFIGQYVVNENGAILLRPNDGSDEFAEAATWIVQPGLVGEGDEWISLEAFATPGSYIGRRFGVTALMEVTDATNENDLEYATFIMEENNG